MGWDGKIDQREGGIKCLGGHEKFFGAAFKGRRVSAEIVTLPTILLRIPQWLASPECANLLPFRMINSA